MYSKSSKLLVLLVSLVLVASFVFAAHDVAVVKAGVFNFDEDVTNLYNLSINNTDLAVNISIVNITLPSSFVYTNGSNATTSSNTSLFSNKSRVLSWNATTNANLVNGSGGGGSDPVYFWFNATAATPGTYNITVTTYNGTAIENNLSVTINDTTNPLISIGTGTEADYANKSQSFVYANVSVTEPTEVNITFLLFNSTGQVNSTTLTDSSRTINWTSLPDGNYTYNVTIYDNAAQSNTTTTRRISLDTANPTVSHSCSPDSVAVGETVTCSCSGADATSGVNSTSFTASPSTANTGVFTKTCTVTDHAGNSDSSNAQYTVESGSSGPSTSGSSTTTGWKKTSTLTEEEFEEGIAKQLGVKERARVSIQDQMHYISVLEVTSTTAKIQIESTPVEATFNINETKMFEVTDDDFYDISVTLNSISNNKADVTIKEVHEKVVESATGEATGEDAISTEDQETMDLAWWWVLIIVIIVVLIGAGMKYRQKKK